MMKQIFQIIRTLTTTHPLNIKVAVCGSSGGVGQATALLLKMSPLLEELTLYDIANPNGVRTDLSHINTRSKVLSYDKPTVLGDALKDKDIVVISAGKARSPGMTRAQLFSVNANIVREIADTLARVAPTAMLCIITNPVNSLVHVAADTLQKAQVYDPKRLFGVTTLDSVRASTFAAELACLDPLKLIIPVIGGHSGETIVPLFSQSSSKLNFPKDQWKQLVERVQNAGTEVVKAKDGEGSATLSMGYAAARFVFALCRALKGEGNVIESAYVESDITDAMYFATPLLLGTCGIEKNLGFGKVTKDECTLINKAIQELMKDIEVGVEFTKSGSKPKDEKKPEKKTEPKKSEEKK